MARLIIPESNICVERKGAEKTTTASPNCEKIIRKNKSKRTFLQEATCRRVASFKTHPHGIHPTRTAGNTYVKHVASKFTQIEIGENGWLRGKTTHFSIVKNNISIFDNNDAKKETRESKFGGFSTKRETKILEKYDRNEPASPEEVLLATKRNLKPVFRNENERVENEKITTKNGAKCSILPQWGNEIDVTLEIKRRLPITEQLSATNEETLSIKPSNKSFLHANCVRKSIGKEPKEDGSADRIKDQLFSSPENNESYSNLAESNKNETKESRYQNFICEVTRKGSDSDIRIKNVSTLHGGRLSRFSTSSESDEARRSPKIRRENCWKSEDPDEKKNEGMYYEIESDYHEYSCLTNDVNRSRPKDTDDRLANNLNSQRDDIYDHLTRADAGYQSSGGYESVAHDGDNSDASLEHSNSLYSSAKNLNNGPKSDSSVSGYEVIDDDDDGDFKEDGEKLAIGTATATAKQHPNRFKRISVKTFGRRRKLAGSRRYKNRSTIRKSRFQMRKRDKVDMEGAAVAACDDICDDFDSDSGSEGNTSDGTTKLDKKGGATCSVDGKLPSLPKTEGNSAQNIYGMVKKASRSVRKRWTSVIALPGQIRKLSVPSNWQMGESSAATKGSLGNMKWPSFKNRSNQLSQSSSSSTCSSAVFYLNDVDKDCMESSVSSNAENIAMNWVESRSDKSARRATLTSALSLSRPNIAPPPPPGKQKSSRYSVPPILNSAQDMPYTLLKPSLSLTPASQSVDEPSSIVTFVDSDADANEGMLSWSDSNNSEGPLSGFWETPSEDCNVNLRFSDEPLYQFYVASVTMENQRGSVSSGEEAIASSDQTSQFNGYEEIGSTTSRPSAMQLVTPCSRGHGQHRSLWSEVEQVRNSGILDTLTVDEQKLQEAKFEVFTSEASYFKSLTVLEKHFANNPLLSNENIFNKRDWKILFGNVSSVKQCSEKLLAELDECWQESILLNGMSDVLYRYATQKFNIYVKYCSNQIYIDRTLKKLRSGESGSQFKQIVKFLESDPMCQSLSLHSFLMLPMQRITRLPLLLDAILSRLHEQTAQTDEYKTLQLTLATLNKIVRECNEGARRLERYEEMLLLSQQLQFKCGVKAPSVASSSRWLIRSGPMIQLLNTSSSIGSASDTKNTFSRKLAKSTVKLYFFLFNDIMFIAKKKGEESFVVFDYCARNMVQMSALDDYNSENLPPALSESFLARYHYQIILTLLENHMGKTVEMILSCESESVRQRWLQAVAYPTSGNPEETLYEEWDCPQVSVLHAYPTSQPDELSLQPGDTVKVLKKMSDGWYYGERISDAEVGWFPGNYCVEIASQHARAKNLKLRYRLLTLSETYLRKQQTTTS